MYILVISKNMSFRKVCMDNLVDRGHVAVGVASFTEGERMLHKALPDVVILCPHTEPIEPEISKIRANYRLKTTPILLVSPERPTREWMSKVETQTMSKGIYPIDS